MAVNEVQMTSDESNVTMFARNISGATPVLFSWGSFKGAPEETRINVVSVTIGTKVVNFRFKWLDLRFNRTTITGGIIPRQALTFNANV